MLLHVTAALIQILLILIEVADLRFYTFPKVSQSLKVRTSICYCIFYSLISVSEDALKALVKVQYLLKIFVVSEPARDTFGVSLALY